LIALHFSQRARKTQGGRLFLPFDFSVTKDLTASVEIGVPITKHYPVYDFKTVTRINMKF
jgi:hypothetical protein